MGVIRGLAQSHVGDVSNGGAYMHAHAGTFPTNPIHTILTSTRLVFDTDVPSVAILTEFVVLWHLAHGPSEFILVDKKQSSHEPPPSRVFRRVDSTTQIWRV